MQDGGIGDKEGSEVQEGDLALLPEADEHPVLYHGAVGDGRKSESDLKKHFQTHHDGQTLFSCDFCPDAKLIHSEKELDTHNYENHPQCRICSTLCKSEAMLSTHFITYHESQNPYECQECKMTFVSKQGLHGHLGSHVRGPNIATVYKCRICSELFMSEIQLIAHFGSEHKGQRPYQCPVSGCERPFSYKTVMDNHING